MSEVKRPIPIGIENFEEMILKKYYYVDKTLLIKDLLDLQGKVNLFTRPRRFGKTLNLSMLKYFFEDTGDASRNAERKKLFDGMKIMLYGIAFYGKTCRVCYGGKADTEQMGL